MLKRSFLAALLAGAVAAVPLSAHAVVGEESAILARVSNVLESILQTNIKIFERIGTVATYYGFNFANPAPSPTTPDIKKINQAQQALAIAQQTQGAVVKQASQKLFNRKTDSGKPAGSLTEQAIQNILNTTLDCPKEEDGSNNCVTSGQVRSYYQGLGISNRFSNPEVSPSGKDNILNFDTLITPTTYRTSGGPTNPFSSSSIASSNNDKPGESAYDFIKFASGLVDPADLYKKIDFIDLSDDEKADFTVKLRNYAALSSVGISNLFYLYNQRLPIPGLGNQAGLSSPNVSQKELEENMVMRTMNKAWHDKMEAASSMTLQRETLYMLAMLNYQTYKKREVDERILATLSAMQLQNANAFIKSGLSGASS